MSFNTLIDWNSCSPEQQQALLMRPAISASDSITRTVAEILDNVKTNGDSALREYSAKFDKTEVGALKVTAEEIQQASGRLSHELKQAMQAAVLNIDTFHTAHTAAGGYRNPAGRALPAGYPPYRLGCLLYSRRLRAAVLYRINAGHPGTYSGCKKVVLCSPPPIANDIRYAAQVCGVENVYKVGGAQAIAALAWVPNPFRRSINLRARQRLRYRSETPGQPASRRRGD
ncbi:histidinol dehydrogenase [Escherichia coli]